MATKKLCMYLDTFDGKLAKAVIEMHSKKDEFLFIAVTKTYKMEKENSIKLNEFLDSSIGGKMHLVCIGLTPRQTFGTHALNGLFSSIEVIDNFSTNAKLPSNFITNIDEDESLSMLTWQLFSLETVPLIVKVMTDLINKGNLSYSMAELLEATQPHFHQDDYIKLLNSPKEEVEKYINRGARFIAGREKDVLFYVNQARTVGSKVANNRYLVDNIPSHLEEDVLRRVALKYNGVALNRVGYSQHVIYTVYSKEKRELDIVKKNDGRWRKNLGYFTILGLTEILSF